MAMSVKNMNEKLEKLLKDLDKAIKDRDLAKVEEAMLKAQELNKKSEGKIYEIPIKTSSSEKQSDEQQETGVLQERIYEYLNKQLEQRVKKMAEELVSNRELDDDERHQIVKVRRKLHDQKKSFEKMEKVIESVCRNESTNQEDLKQYKEQQKDDNLIRIDIMKEKTQEMTKLMIDIEERYLKPIEEKNNSIEIINQIFKKRDIIRDMQGTGMDETVDSIKLEIENLLLKLSSNGIDVNDCDLRTMTFTSLEEEKNNLKESIDEIVSGIKKDSKLPSEWGNEFKNIKSKQKLENKLKDKYKEIVRKRQECTSEIAKLRAENKQIDKTIQILEREENYKNVAYNDDGTLKTDSEIARIVLSSEDAKERVEQLINGRKFDSRSWFKRHGAIKDYYKRTFGYEDIPSKGVKGFFKKCTNNVKAFFKAFGRSNAKDIKMLATVSAAAYLGKEYANNAKDGMKKRQDDFKEAIKSAATREVFKNPEVNRANISEDIRKEAYKSALGETISEREDGNR